MFLTQGHAGGNEPRLWSNETAEYTLIYRSDRNVTVSQRLHTDGSITYFPLETIPGNPLVLPMDEFDYHFKVAICVDGLGYIHITGNAHASWGAPERRYVRSANPNDITAWVDGNQFISDLTTEYGGYTYNQFAMLPDRTVLWMFSSHDQAPVVGRDSALYRMDPTATEWLPWDHLDGGVGEVSICNEVEEDGDPERAYVFNLHVSQTGIVYLTGAFQMVALDGTTRKHPWCLRSLDGARSWQSMSGDAPLSMPVTLPIIQATPNALITTPFANTLGMNSMCEYDGSPFLVSFTHGGARSHLWIPGYGWISSQHNHGAGANTGVVWIKRYDSAYYYGQEGDIFTMRRALGAGPETIQLFKQVPGVDRWIPFTSPTNIGEFRCAWPYDETHRVIGFGAGRRNRL